MEHEKIDEPLKLLSDLLDKYKPVYYVSNEYRGFVPEGYTPFPLKLSLFDVCETFIDGEGI